MRPKEIRDKTGVTSAAVRAFIECRSRPYGPIVKILEREVDDLLKDLGLEVIVVEEKGVDL